MYLHDKAEIIFKGKKYKADVLRSQIEQVKQRIEQASIDGKRPVAIALERSPELIVAMFALLELEVPFLPIDMEQPEERLLGMLEQAGVTHIIMAEKRNLCFKHIKNIPYDVVSTKKEIYTGRKYANEVAYVLFTSGSTGKPKAVEVTRKGLSNFIEGISEIIDFKEGKVLISLTTHTFDIFFLESILALAKGLCVVLAAEDERKNPKRIEELIIRHHVEMVQMTPSTMQLLYFYERELKYLKNVKEIMLGGEAFPMRLLENLQNLTSARIYNMYGPTETTIWSSVAELTNEKEIHIGKPIKHTKIYLLDETLKPVPEGVTGEICIAGDGLAKGYKNNDSLTGQAFVYLEDGVRVYRTGDYGIINESGKLKCLGRNDDQIKIRGHRVELEDIDNNLKLFPEILDCVTCFAENERSMLVTFYIADKEIQHDRISHFLSKKIPSYMMPNQYKRVTEFLYNGNGKLDRKGLVKKYCQSNENGCPDCTNKLEAYEGRVLQIMADCMETVEIPLHSKTKIKDLNLDSLTYVRIVVSLEEEYAVSFDTECLTSSYFTTVEEIEDYIYAKKDKDGGKYLYGKTCGITGE